MRVLHDHAVGADRRARRLQLRHLLDLDDADAAGAVDADAGVVAVVGHRDAALDRGLQDGLALLDGHRAAVDRQRHGFHKHQEYKRSLSAQALTTPDGVPYIPGPAPPWKPHGRGRVFPATGSLRRPFWPATLLVGDAGGAGELRGRPVAPWPVPPSRRPPANAAVPSDAVSVPTLLLGAGNEIRVGDARAEALARLDASVDPRQPGRGTGSARRARGPRLSAGRHEVHPRASSPSNAAAPRASRPSTCKSEGSAGFNQVLRT